MFSGVGGNGSNFVNTVFDDAAENSITTGTAPFTGTFQPTGTLSTLDGHTVDIKNSVDQWVPGVWTLQLTNTMTGVTGTLDNWSLNITPVITVTPVNPVNGTATHVHDRLPAAAAQRHLHDPAWHRASWTRSASSSIPTRTRALPCCGARLRTARRPPSTTPRPICPSHPGADRDDRRAR